MPIYEYACRKCGHELDALQKVSDAPLRKCPECGSLSLKRLVSAPQFRLKGTGWYETDFKKDKRKRVAEAESGDGKAEAAKPDKTDKADGAKADKKDAGAAAGKPEKKEKKPAASTPAAD